MHPRVTTATLLALALLAAPALAFTEAPAAGDGLAAPLARAAGVDASLAPASVTESLPALVARADAKLGIVRPAADLAPLADLDPRLSLVLADLLSAVLDAADARDAAFAGVSDAEIAALADDEGSPGGLAVASRVDALAVREAAVRLSNAVEAARPALEALAAERAVANAALPALPEFPRAPPTVDVFPVIGVDPLGVANSYPHDYFLSVDLGGNDVYDNNAGGSIITRGFKIGDPSTFGPTVAGLTIGGEFEDAQESYTATVAIDVAGDDTYGVYKTPSTVGGSRDRFCTSGLLIRRIVTQGAGSGGIGQLYDLAGNDWYRAKTLSQGHGHVAGVGYLHDATGNDRYTAIRSSQGSAVLQGAGVLVDLAGDDRHETASPAGGIWNVDQGRCDATGRIVLGAAVAQGAAAFADLAGADTYRVGNLIQSLGYGDGFGYGAFVDAAGDDDYGAYPGRGDGVRIATPGAVGTSVFWDLE